MRSVADKRPATEPVPETLDWNKWLGPLQTVDYSPAYLPGYWCSWFESGTGTLGDWFCHNADAPYAILGLDCPTSVEIESAGKKKLLFPGHSKVIFTFPYAG
ncbi:hypothetical protein EGM51_04860 [Verrucomicrobia bacterium S94]|nr:hypothetical protein EGM51_04860 [Verrucomicrobia bacterium S94]